MSLFAGIFLWLMLFAYTRPESPLRKDLLKIFFQTGLLG